MIDTKNNNEIIALIAITNFSDYCKWTSKDTFAFAPVLQGTVTKAAVFISWFTVLPQLTNNHSKNIFYKLLQYIETDILENSPMLYILYETDEFLEWQHEVLTNETYLLAGQRTNTTWWNVIYPSETYFFVKKRNIQFNQNTSQNDDSEDE